MAKLSASGKDLLAQMQAAVEKEWGQIQDQPWDPLIQMAVYAANPALPPSLKFKAHAEITQYIYAKRKAVELESDGAPRILLVQFSNSGQERIIGEIHEGIAHVHTESGDPGTATPQQQLALDGPDVEKDDAEGRVEADRGNGDLVRH